MTNLLNCVVTNLLEQPQPLWTVSMTNYRLLILNYVVTNHLLEQSQPRVLGE